MELVSLDESVWHIDFVVNQEFDEAYLDSLALWLILELFVIGFDSHICVVENALDDEILVLVVNLKTGVEMLRIIFMVMFVDALDGVSYLVLRNIHISFGNGSSLANA